MKLSYQSYRLIFKNPSGTSRGVLHEKETFLLRLDMEDVAETEYFGEAGLFRGLSFDDKPEFEEKLKEVCANFDWEDENWWEKLREYPAIQFGMEQILQALQHKELQSETDAFNPLLFPSEFTEGIKGITINGLIWMGSIDFMKEQIRQKLKEEFRCIKLKIGVDWKEEYKILQQLRNEFSADDLELRVDANGGFQFKEAPAVLEQLAELKIHSIEQPLKAGHIREMAELCESTPIPIALDEELIGIVEKEEKKKLIETIHPQYLILKPSLIGGWEGSEEWIDFAGETETGWWVTSALESNIGLNAIAQWTYTLGNPMPSGLGTGGLFKNNFYSRLKLMGDRLFFV